MTAGSLLFMVCSALCLSGAFIVVLAKNPIRGALGLLTTIIGIAGLFLRLNAQFLAAMQILVYAGAVVILFVFVIMLMGAGAETGHEAGPKVKLARGLGGGLAAILGVLALGLIGFGDHHLFQTITPAHGSIEAIGSRIFVDGLVPFELVTVLLLVAVVGAIAVARSNPATQHKPKLDAQSAHATKRLFAGALSVEEADRASGRLRDEEAPTFKEST